MFYCAVAAAAAWRWCAVGSRVPRCGRGNSSWRQSLSLVLAYILSLCLLLDRCSGALGYGPYAAVPEEREIERKLAGNLENVNSKREMEINIGEVRRRRLSAPFCERASFFERAIFFVASGGCCWRRAAGFSFAYNLRGRGKFKGGARSTGREWRPQFIFVFSFLEWGKGKMCFLRRGI